MAIVLNSQPLLSRTSNGANLRSEQKNKFWVTVLHCYDSSAIVKELLLHLWLEPVENNSPFGVKSSL